MPLRRPTRLIWFRNNLRLDDNPALVEAVKLANQQSERVLPFYCFDTTQFFARTTPFGNPKTGKFRAKFTLEAVEDLRRNLRAIGSDLLVAVGDPAQHMAAIGPAAVHFPAEVTWEERKQERCARKACKTAAFIEHWDHTLYHYDDLPPESRPNRMALTCSVWRNSFEKKIGVRPPLASPTSIPLPDREELEEICAPQRSFDFMPSLQHLGFPEDINVESDPRGVMSFRGGETAARERVQTYFFEKNCLKDYKETRNGMLGPNYSTKFAPWMAAGCISARRIHEQVKLYETKTGIRNKSTYWVVFEMIFRDFFRFLSIKFGNSMFFVDGPYPREGAEWKNPNTDPEAMEALHRWKTGTTGMPLVDANMRELAATGWMSNRGRQNVASYLIFDLGLDWRHGADWFESVLLDYDVTQNWGNWVSAAGLTKGRLNRFNIAKQTKDYDPQGKYIHHWVPELAGVPEAHIATPWKMNKSQQLQAGVRIGQDYPAPMFLKGSRRESSSSGFESNKRQVTTPSAKQRLMHEFVKQPQAAAEAPKSEISQKPKRRNKQRLMHDFVTK